MWDVTQLMDSLTLPKQKSVLEGIQDSNQMDVQAVTLELESSAFTFQIQQSHQPLAHQYIRTPY